MFYQICHQFFLSSRGNQPEKLPFIVVLVFIAFILLRSSTLTFWLLIFMILLRLSPSLLVLLIVLWLMFRHLTLWFLWILLWLYLRLWSLVLIKQISLWTILSHLRYIKPGEIVMFEIELEHDVFVVLEPLQFRLVAHQVRVNLPGQLLCDLL